MSQQHLDDPDIDALLEQVCGKRVAQCMRAYICILMDRLLVPNDASKIEAALDRFWKRSMAELWGPRPSARTVIRWRVMRAIELAAKRSRKEG